MSGHRARKRKAQVVTPAPQYVMPLRFPTVPDMPVVVIKPFFVECGCTCCNAQIMVDGAGEFACPGCGCHVVVAPSIPAVKLVP